MKKHTQKVEKQNEFPVLKFDYNLKMIYSNPAGRAILNHWNIENNQSLTSDIKNYSEIYGAMRSKEIEDIQIKTSDSVISLSVVAFPEAGYIGLYGYMVEYCEQVKEKAAVA